MACSMAKLTPALRDGIAATCHCDLVAHTDVYAAIAHHRVRLLRTNLVGAVERVTDHLATPPPLQAPRQPPMEDPRESGRACQRRVRTADRVRQHDLPGTLLASAAHTYVKRYGCGPGARARDFHHNDSAYAAALGIARSSVAIAAVVDDAHRASSPAHCQRKHARGLTSSRRFQQSSPQHGRQHVTAVDIAPIAAAQRRAVSVAISCVYPAAGTRR